MFSSLKDRVSVRKYTEQAIPAELLNELLETACRAANTGNMQTYSIVVTQDQSVKEALSPCHFNQPSIKQAPVVVTFCADFNRFNKWCEQRNAVPGYDNFLSFTSAMIDATIVAEHFCVAAESEGLGTCYFGTTTYNAHKIIDVLKLPKFVVPIVTLTIGYPAETPNPVDRLPLEGIVHFETYQDYSAEDIDQIYAYKESLPENKQFIAENNKETLAQVFTDVRYTKNANETFSVLFLDVLKKQGYLPE
ncbi:nitroreductase family protein [Paludibacter sp.]|uniref:nitroreductase family protein n=1 Tax=Paludibacter sp. TaxID=1898105 RepID=UPI001352E2BC|nr:nitroreductase family protein [Paludibacter sp.]MTK52570.1 NADPH-dependent oxidoreductase [Paludibacter sp.]